MDEPRDERWQLAGTNVFRLVGGIAVAAGWIGVYYAFQGHWLGILLALVATGITFGVVYVGDLRARSQTAALRDALASAAARNRELERLRRVAATLLASSESAPCFRRSPTRRRICCRRRVARSRWWWKKAGSCGSQR